ncbi:MAG: VWA domain-containing protein, partial [Pyrinomonadaceae bacterium]
MPNKISVLFALILAFAASSLAQIPTATPKPAEEDVVKISTELVQVDVTVTDQNGHVIKDLKPSDFEIYQNGKKQPISNFSFISNVSATAAKDATIKPAAGTDPKKQANMVPPPQIRAANVRRTIALVVDDLNLSWISMVAVQDALKRFVDRDMQPGDLVAIIRTGAGIGALQQFTNDKRQLYAAIDRVKFGGVGTGHIAAFAPMESKPDVPSGMDNTDALNKSVDEFKNSVMATGALGALGFVIRGMADLPGRKSIMMFSDGFELYPTDQNGDRESTRVYDAIRSIVDGANRASVVIYTFDPRGLVTT